MTEKIYSKIYLYANTRHNVITFEVDVTVWNKNIENSKTELFYEIKKFLNHACKTTFSEVIIS